MNILISFVVAVAILYAAASLIVFFMACRRFPEDRNPMAGLTHTAEKLLAPHRKMMDEGKQWIGDHDAEELYIQSYDGLRLHARLYEHPSSKAVLVACHGYRSDSIRDFAPACSFYYDHGFSILLIDERATLQSEGKYITFGVKESRDAHDWCEKMSERFPKLPIALAGISMGASAVLMTADHLPKNVKAIVSDCGFVNPKEEIIYVARHLLKHGTIMLLPGVNLWCRILGGFGFNERTTICALANTDRPVLFIHGESDELVPLTNSVKNCAACSSVAETFYVPNAGHGMSYVVDQKGYHQTTESFLKQYVLEASA